MPPPGRVCNLYCTPGSFMRRSEMFRSLVFLACPLHEQQQKTEKKRRIMMCASLASPCNDALCAATPLVLFWSAKASCVVRLGLGATSNLTSVLSCEIFPHEKDWLRL